MNKLTIAAEQLDDACELFCRGRYASALTVAGASEELLGALLKKQSASLRTALGERVAVMALLKKKGMEDEEERKSLIAFLNHPRNAVKHLETASKRKFELKEEADDMIERAVLNYRRLTGDFPDFDSFIQYWSGK